MSKWKPKSGEEFYIVTQDDEGYFIPVRFKWDYFLDINHFLKKNLNSDNYFKTKAQATEAAKTIKELLKGLKEIE